MKKRIIISESEKNTILGLYNLLKEDPSDTQKYKNGETYKYESGNQLYKVKSFNDETKEYTLLFSAYDGGGNFGTNDFIVTEKWFGDKIQNNKLKKITQQEYETSLKEMSSKSKNTENETKKDSDESITISGIVKQGTIDGKKGVIDAIVTIEEKDDKNNSKSAETDVSGGFKVVLPYVGKYRVTVEKKGYQTYSKTFNFNDDVTFNIPLSPKKGIIPKIKRGVQNIIDKLKDYYDTRDPIIENAILFTRNGEERDEEIWEDSESQQEYCRNFTEHYFNFVIVTNNEVDDVDGAKGRSPDDEKLNGAKNFIMFCKKQYGNKLFASSMETKRKFDKIFATLQNLPPKVKRYQI